MAATPFRIALASCRVASTPDESVRLAVEVVEKAGATGARIVCFSECYVPGYRAGTAQPAPDAGFLDRAWSAVAAASARARVAVVLGTERIATDSRRITALVLDADGRRIGFQDKVQLDPSEDACYSPGSGRRLFQVGPLRFGVVICHEGWRYPETVREAVRQGAHLVFHPHFGAAEPGSFRPSSFADPANTFHEKAALCRAAENTCYFATVNAASEGAPTATALAAPDGSLLAWQPYGVEGLLVADIDLDRATGYLASRLRT
jgi:predicted amidohydrolase